MKRIVTLVVLVVFISCFSASADTTYPPFNYLFSKGYRIERLRDSPGWKTCNLICDDEWCSLNFSDNINAWSIMIAPTSSPSFKFSDFFESFIEMVDMFDWDISFYWPDYDAVSKMALSYNIVNDIENTNANYTDKAEYVEALRNQFKLISEPVPNSDPALPNSRRNPATIGQPVSINVSRPGLNYTMRVVVDEFYRGSDYTSFVGDYCKTAASDCEFVAVKVTVTFESINSIRSSVLGTDDPEIYVDAIMHFSSYSKEGTEYDNVHYSIYGMKKLTNVYEGASTTGYFQFEISKDDPAPILVYEPEIDQKVFISLQ